MSRTKGETRVLGIRHHGPGSARRLGAALARFCPEVVLIEGPPDAEGLLRFARADLQPPVALMIYDPEEPRRAAFYPFAAFSPEWVAIRWATDSGVEVRFMDLPIRHQMALDAVGWGLDPDESVPPQDVPIDPLSLLAAAAGEGDGERWWSRVIEEGRSGDDAFAAVTEAMRVLRQEVGAESTPHPRDARREALREAYMRRTIRSAERRGGRLAVVVGAWHAPALVDRPPAKEDDALLRRLPRQRVSATWIAWTHGRLALRSGYGAGIEAPGWYHHLYTADEDVTEGWLTRVARLLREQGRDVPPSSVIDAVRLAEALCALRGRAYPGLDELTEASVASFLHGKKDLLARIDRGLTVGEVLGSVPEGVPEVPLAADIRRLQRSLRLRPEPESKVVMLDLRDASGRAKSQLLRRLLVLDIPWGQGGERGQGRGTFKEAWTLAWRPELALRVADAASWGTTLNAAARARLRARLMTQESLHELVVTIEQLLFAGLTELLDSALKRLDEKAADADTLSVLADAVSPLARIARYGDARGTDRDLLRLVLDGLVARLAAGLVSEAVGLGPVRAEALAQRIDAVDAALRIVDDEATRSKWWDGLARLADGEVCTPLCRGRAVRRLYDASRLDSDGLHQQLVRALAHGSSPVEAATWLEGFIGGNALPLIHDLRLLRVLDRWLGELSEAAFRAAVPLLRRTFSFLESPERARLSARVQTGLGALPDPVESSALDPVGATLGVSVAARLLGLATVDEEDA